VSTFQAQEAFISHCYRSGLLAGAEDFRVWWSMWCMGSMSNEM